jgi:Holliday junction resolvase RusA-like endonuclease
VIWNLVVDGPPASKKNSQQLGYVGKKCPACGRALMRIFPSKDYRNWERSALKQLAPQWHDPPLGSKDQILWVRAVFYLAKRQRPDLTNLEEAVGDLLEKAGVITNDYWIGSWDGSRKAKDWEEPRVEITIRLM